MEITWLEDFLALAECGSFSRAAEARHLTQPAFSRRIRALEDWVGAPLFDRTVQPVALTQAGVRFRPAADETLRRLHQGREEARHAMDAAATTLRFAATHSLSLTFFPEWLRALEARARVGAIRLDSDNMAACEQLLLSGQSQFLLCHQHPAVPGRLDARQFRSVRVGEDVLVPVAAPGAGFRLPGAAGAPLPHLAYAEGSALGRAVAAALAAREVWLNQVFTAHQAVLLRGMAQDGRGVAWLPRTLVRDDLERGTLVPAGAEDWSVPVEVHLFRPRSRMSLAAEAFWMLVA
ncbi:MAG TPA: LysR substrate-binding domain-containing protein [Azospirillum sp.]|nr:LysR substrate-binding domain-containing protein [Azospirillum sp.]